MRTSVCVALRKKEVRALVSNGVRADDGRYAVTSIDTKAAGSRWQEVKNVKGKRGLAAGNLEGRG